jgi:hypothetical protein
LRLQKVLSEDGQELQLFCHSPSRQLKEEAMLESFSQRFEAGLQQILDGLAKPRAEKRPTNCANELAGSSRRVAAPASITRWTW